MFCKYCGRRLPEEANYCFNCGKDLQMDLEEFEAMTLRDAIKKAKYDIIEPYFYTTEELAAMWKSSIPTTRHTMKRSDFPLVIVGKNFRVEKSALIRWASRKLDNR